MHFLSPWLFAARAGDFDDDRFDDSIDNCPSVAAPDQDDTDLEGFGDACDSCVGLGAGRSGFQLGRALLGNPQIDDARTVLPADLDGDGDADLVVTYDSATRWWVRIP